MLFDISQPGEVIRHFALEPRGRCRDLASLFKRAYFLTTMATCLPTNLLHRPLFVFGSDSGRKPRAQISGSARTFAEIFQDRRLMSYEKKRIDGDEFLILSLETQ